MATFVKNSEDANWNYLTAYCKESKRNYKATLVLSKKENGMLIASFDGESLPKKRNYSKGDIQYVKEQDIEGFRREEEVGYEGSWWRSGNKIQSVSYNEMRTNKFRQKKRDSFSFEKEKERDYKEYGITLICPDSPAILNQMCKNGDFIYAGKEDVDFWYSVY